jgi:hypothetical protein
MGPENDTEKMMAPQALFVSPRIAHMKSSCRLCVILIAFSPNARGIAHTSHSTGFWVRTKIWCAWRGYASAAGHVFFRGPS